MGGLRGGGGKKKKPPQTKIYVDLFLLILGCLFFPHPPTGMFRISRSATCYLTKCLGEWVFGRRGKIKEGPHGVFLFFLFFWCLHELCLWEKTFVSLVGLCFGPIFLFYLKPVLSPQKGAPHPPSERFLDNWIKRGPSFIFSCKKKKE